MFNQPSRPADVLLRPRPSQGIREHHLECHRYSTKAEISARFRNDEVTIHFDDNGAAFRWNGVLMPCGPLSVSKRRNRQTGGTGLGLSITSDIILRHGGERLATRLWRTSGLDKATGLTPLTGEASVSAYGCHQGIAVRRNQNNFAARVCHAKGQHL